MIEQTDTLLLNTYGVLTAESILAYANVNLSRADLEMQLLAHDSFYAELIKVPTQIVFNSLLNTQCRDLQSYSQERLIEYILSGIEYKMTSDPEVALKNKIEDQRAALIQLGADLTALESAHYEFMLSVYVVQEKQAQQWSDEIDQHVERLWQEIEQCKSDMPKEYKERLARYLKTQAATIVISDKDLKAFKIKRTPSSIEKAVIQLFVDVGTQICPNVIESAKNAEVEINELQQGLKQEREILLSTTEDMKVALIEKNREFAEKREVINDLLLEVDQNVNAFKASEDTINNNLNMNTLEDLGLPKQ